MGGQTKKFEFARLTNDWRYRVVSTCSTDNSTSEDQLAHSEMEFTVAPSIEQQVPGLTDLWAQSLGDPRICIAILDGPVDLTHPSLAGAALTEINLDEVRDSGSSTNSDHGTHVASVIFGNHDGPVKGVAPNCRGLIIPIFRYATDGSLESCSQQRLAKAIRTAARFGANVINISAGQFSSSGEAGPELRSAIEECGKDVLIVAAAGNDGCDCLHVPGALPSVLAVGAMNSAGQPLPFSNWGEAYRAQGVLAPGERVVGASSDGGVKAQSGTSFATPIVSGVAGLLLSLQQKLGVVPSSSTVRSAILQTTHGCDPQTETQCERVLAGRLNLSGCLSVVTRGTNIMQNATSNPAPADVGSPQPAASQLLTSPTVGAVQAAAAPGDAVDASACCGGCAGGAKQRAYAIGEIDYDFPSLSRLHSLQHSMAVLTSTGAQLQVQQKLDFARHLCGFNEIRIEAISGGIASVGKVAAGAGVPNEYVGKPELTISNGALLKPEDDQRCILIDGMLLSQSGEPAQPWIANGRPLRIGYLTPTTFCLLDATVTRAETLDPTKAHWILPQNSPPKETRDPNQIRRHPAHRYDAASVIWKLKRGSTNLYAVKPAASFSEDAYDELTDFLLESLGYGRAGLDIYYFGWGDSVRIWPGDWDPTFNTRDCQFDLKLSQGCPPPSKCCNEIVEQLANTCNNYQNTKSSFRYDASPRPLARNLPRSQRAAVPGQLGGEVALLNGQVLREIVPDMRGTLSWSLATLLDLILGAQSTATNSLNRQLRTSLRSGLTSLLQHFDRRIRNAGISSGDRALNYAATRLQDILVEYSSELIEMNTNNGKVKVFELDEIAPPIQNHVGPPGSDCWDVEITFFDPRKTTAARVVVAQTIDVSDVVPNLVEDPKIYRRR